MLLAILPERAHLITIAVTGSSTCHQATCVPFVLISSTNILGQTTSNVMSEYIMSTKTETTLYCEKFSPKDQKVVVEDVGAD